MVIKQNRAMLCLRVGCAVIWEGPSMICPECKQPGATYLELEQLLLLSTEKMMVEEMEPITHMIQ